MLWKGASTLLGRTGSLRRLRPINSRMEATFGLFGTLFWASRCCVRGTHCLTDPCTAPRSFRLPSLASFLVLYSALNSTMAPPNLSSNDPTVQTPEGQKQFIHSYLNDNDVYPSFEAETKLNKADLSPQAQARLTELRENGYVILRNVLDANQVQRVKNALAAVGHKMYGRNRFEGTKTVRVNGLVGKHVVFSGMAEHPEIMELVDGILLPNFQMTLMQSIQIFPGEVRQPLHYDELVFELLG